MRARCGVGVLILLNLCSSQAIAGTGPWVLSQGDYSAYGEVQYQQWQRVADENGETKSIGNRSLISRVHFVGSYGVVPNLEAEIKLGVAGSSTSDPSAGACGELSCKSLFGVTPLEARLKWQIIDEWALAPLSVALIAATRMGSFSSKDRHRLTSFSEGTLDASLGLVLGRSGLWGRTATSGWLEVQYRHRVPVGIPVSAGPSDEAPLAVPGPEIVIQGDWMFQPSTTIGLGIAWDILYRTSGTNLSDMDPTNRDAIASLAAQVVKLGLKFDVRNTSHNAISIGMFHVVYARNNPADMFLISIGMSRFVPKPLHKDNLSP